MDRLINQVIENYKFVSVLGKGGMGIVYKVYDMKLDRYVAIKILSAHIIDKPKSIERFKREAKNQAQLTHPNIVTVYGFIEYERLLGIVMEYAEGDSIDKLIYKHKKLHVNDAVYIMKQALVGMGYAHKKGFVHRDIKPSNIIVNKEGAVKIMDFGISKSLLEKGVTKTGSKIGTVLYMSPEQVRGEDVTHASDIYSLGCTFYEMLVGEPPFYLENDYDVMEGHLKKTPKKVSQIVSGLPREIDVVLDISLQKEALHRYPTCEGFNTDIYKLESHLANLQSEIFKHKAQNPKKKKVFSIIGFTFFLIFLAGLIYFAYLQADGLIKSNQLSDLKKYSIKTLFNDSENTFTFKSISGLAKPTEKTINAFKMIDNSFGFIAGNSSTFFTTSDSGKSWRQILLPETKNLNDFHFDLNGKAIVVGDSSTILISDDYFTTYKQVNLYGNTNILGVTFKNVATGFIYGSKGLIARSDDGGLNWERITSNTNETIFDVHFVTDQVGFAVGWNGVLLKTTDGGRSWRNEEPISSKYLKAIDFADEDNGVIVGGGGAIFVTTNGGISWKNVSSKSAGGLQQVKFVNENFVVAVGGRGKIIVSEDGGFTWKTLEADIYTKLNDITVSPNKAIYIAGVNGTIIKLR